MIPRFFYTYKTLLFWVWLILMSTIVNAQSHYASGSYFDIIKQFAESGATPVKAELKADINSPVNLLTGAACFDIPIYSIEIGDFKLPITLHYETSGFKLVDFASNLGMGWNISAGGCITRTVKGIPDEQACVGYCSLGVEADSIHNLLLALKDREDFDTLAQNPSQQDNSMFAALLSLTNNLIDAEPDIYSFSFAGYSGSFVYDIDGDIHLIPQQNLIVQKNATGFTITVDNGDKFFFENGNAVEIMDTIIDTPFFEYLDNFETNNAGIYYQNRYYSDINLAKRKLCPIAWNLTKIVLADSSKEILFQYETDTTRIYLGTDETFLMGQRFIDRTNYQFQSGYNWTVSRINSYRFSHIPRIRRITWNNGSIDFIPSLNYREDLDYRNEEPVCFGSRSIDSIVVSSMNNQQNTNENFSIGLTHSYFGDNQTISQPGYPYRFHYKRLRLDAVKYYDSENNHLYDYRFLYNTINPSECPSRNSCQVDYWGFYRPRNVSFIESRPIKPKLYYYENGKENPLYNSVYSVWPRSGSIEPTCVLDGYDMTPDAEGSQEFTLHSVVLPTKGTIVYNYERNDFWFDDQEIKGPGVRVQSVEYQFHNDYGNGYTKSYSYREGSRSSGKVSVIPDIGQFQLYPSSLMSFPGSTQCENINYHTIRKFSTISDEKGMSESLVHYSKVTETIANSIANMGKTVYHHQLYFTAEDSVLSVNNDAFVKKTKCRQSHAHMFPPNAGFGNSIYIGQHLDATPKFTYPIVSWFDGFLIKQDFYDKFDRLLESKEYKYSLNPENDSVFYIQAKFLERYIAAWTFFDQNGNALPNQPIYQYDILWGVNYYKTGTKHLDTIIHKRYDQDNGALVNTTVKTRGYNQQNYISVEQTVNSDGDIIRQHFIYPSDYSTGSVYQLMLNKNMKNSIIEQYTSVNNKVIKGVYCQYVALGTNNCFIKPQTIFTLQTDQPLSSFQPSNALQGYDSHYKRKEEIQYSPISGNIVEINDEDTGTITFVWGYNDSRIIAEVRNATADQIQNGLTCTLTALNTKTDTEELINIFNNLRTALPQAMVTSYTYNLFLKTLSVTDPSGKTLRYEYDAAQRLKLTRDVNNSILQKYEYHYR